MSLEFSTSVALMLWPYKLTKKATRQACVKQMVPWQRLMNALKLTEYGEATCNLPLNISLHRQVGISADAEVARQ
jgi:hypothetical protein